MKKITKVFIVFVVLGMLASCGKSEGETSDNYDVSSEVESTQADDIQKGSDLSEAQNEEMEKDEPEEDISASTEDVTDIGTSLATQRISIRDIPAYSGDAYIVVNDNIPYFTDEDLSAESFEYYSELDSLGRCGVCVASIGQDIMPTEERGEIGDTKPSGWHTVKYPDLIDGNYLYNRCHLIGFQLAGENANINNLITGTRYLNVEGMLPFENIVADFVKETGYHVMYRVTPVFSGDNLVADGVLIEAESVEDKGRGILFNVFCYNIQPGISIDYATGDSVEDGSVVAEENSTPEPEQIPEATAVSEPQASVSTPSDSGAYAVNSNNGKIHITGACPATGDGKNAMKHPVYFGSYEEAEAYSIQIAPRQDKRKCGNCW